MYMDARFEHTPGHCEGVGEYIVYAAKQQPNMKRRSSER